MKRYLSIALLISASLATAGTIDSGEEAYERCALCHGLFGNTPRYKFPKLAGQRPQYLESQIHNFITGQRNNDGGQMASVVTEISNPDIQVVVQWFSSQVHPEPIGTNDNAGAELFSTSGCTSCHTESAADNMVVSAAVSSPVPLLHAQHPEYLAKQMREFRDGERAGDTGGVMIKQLKALSDKDLEAIARYLAAQARNP